MARVRVTDKGTGEVSINGENFISFFPRIQDRYIVFSSGFLNLIIFLRLFFIKAFNRCLESMTQYLSRPANSDYSGLPPDGQNHQCRQTSMTGKFFRLEFVLSQSHSKGDHNCSHPFRTWYRMAVWPQLLLPLVTVILLWQNCMFTLVTAVKRSIFTIPVCHHGDFFVGKSNIICRTALHTYNTNTLIISCEISQCYSLAKILFIFYTFEYCFLPRITNVWK